MLPSYRHLDLLVHYHFASLGSNYLELITVYDDYFHHENPCGYLFNVHCPMSRLAPSSLGWPFIC